MQKLDKGRMRQNNLRLLFWEIYRCRGISKAGLAERTGMSAMAVGRIAEILLELGMITEEDSLPGVGRPAKQLVINRQRLSSVGVSLDRDGAVIALADPYGNILRRQTLGFPAAAMEGADALRRVEELAGRFLGEPGLPPVNGIGMVLPGLVDHETGTLRMSSQLKWENLAVAGSLSRGLQVPVLVDNDIKARVLAEHRFGAGRNYRNLVLLNMGSGIGAGVVIDDVLYRGKDNMAGEIGHVAVNPSGRMCQCGRIGCLQTNLTESAILQEAHAIRPGLDFAGLMEGYREGEGWIRALLGRVAEYLLITLNLLANTYAPEAVVLCGELIDRYPIFREIITTAFSSQYTVFLSSEFDLLFSALGADGNVISAAAMAFQHNVEEMLSGNTSER